METGYLPPSAMHYLGAPPSPVPMPTYIGRPQLPPSQRPQQICKDFNNKGGMCPRGNSCPFLHIYESEQPGTRRRPCKDWIATGSCPRGSMCPWLHSDRSFPVQKTDQICKDFNNYNGYCPRGEFCPFQHVKERDRYDFKRVASSRPCRHWMREGCCPRGDTCAFLHDDPHTTTTRPMMIEDTSASVGVGAASGAVVAAEEIQVEERARERVPLSKDLRDLLERNKELMTMNTRRREENIKLKSEIVALRKGNLVLRKENLSLRQHRPASSSSASPSPSKASSHSSPSSSPFASCTPSSSPDMRGISESRQHEQRESNTVQPRIGRKRKLVINDEEDAQHSKPGRRRKAEEEQAFDGDFDDESDEKDGDYTARISK